jgi:hypothetical protein
MTVNHHSTITYHIYICRMPDMFFKVFHLQGLLMLAEAMKSYGRITFILKDLRELDLLQNCNY